jgi:hypothetical protein
MKEIYEFIQTLCILTVVLLGVVTLAKIAAPSPPNSSEVDY